MLESQRIELRLVELRSAIAAHPADGETGALEALTTEYRAADVRRAACLITESADLDAARASGDLDAGQRELDAIGSNLHFGNYVSAAVEMRAVDSAEAEYNSGVGMSARQFPLAMLAPARVQMRATTDTDGQANSHSWLDRLFAASAMARLQISMESVPPGQAVFHDDDCRRNRDATQPESGRWCCRLDGWRQDDGTQAQRRTRRLQH